MRDGGGARSRRGAGWIELCLAMLILAASLPPLLDVAVTSSRGVASSRHRMVLEVRLHELLVKDAAGADTARSDAKSADTSDVEYAHVLERATVTRTVTERAPGLDEVTYALAWNDPSTGAHARYSVSRLRVRDTLALEARHAMEAGEP